MLLSPLFDLAIELRARDLVKLALSMRPIAIAASSIVRPCRRFVGRIGRMVRQRSFSVASKRFATA